jgi:hypothetical protein
MITRHNFIKSALAAIGLLLVPRLSAIQQKRQEGGFIPNGEKPFILHYDGLVTISSSTARALAKCRCVPRIYIIKECKVNDDERHNDCANV